MILASLAALGATVVAFVLIPVFSDDRKTTAGLTDEERKLLDLEEKKSRLYAAISDLDFEKAAGKVSDADYDRARDDYLAQVAEVMAGIDALAAEKRAADKTAKEEDKAAKNAGRRCPSCGAASPLEAKFCVHCGEPLAARCAACGHELPEGARFCPGCGEKIA